MNDDVMKTDDSLDGDESKEVDLDGIEAEDLDIDVDPELLDGDIEE